MLFSITGMISMPLHFPLHCFKTNLSLILVAPLWPQKKQFADLPALLVAEPLELSLLWNLLVQPHQKVPQRSGDAATLLMEVVWRLFHKAGFSKEAGESWLWTSKDPRNVSARESGLDSIGIVKKISLWKATDLQKAALLLYLQRELRVSAPAVEDYRTAHNHVFSLTGMDLAANEVISRMLSSFENTHLPREAKPLKCNWSLVLGSLTRLPYKPIKLSSVKHLTWKTCFLLTLTSAKKVTKLHGLSSRVWHSQGWKSCTSPPGSGFHD